MALILAWASASMRLLCNGAHQFGVRWNTVRWRTVLAISVIACTPVAPVLGCSLLPGRENRVLDAVVHLRRRRHRYRVAGSVSRYRLVSSVGVDMRVPRLSMFAGMLLLAGLLCPAAVAADLKIGDLSLRLPLLPGHCRWTRP